MIVLSHRTKALLCAAAIAIASAASGAPNPCNKCEDLCLLIDQYQQKEKQIELYQRYAGPRPQRIPRAGESAQDAVEREFIDWLRVRELPCVIPLSVLISNAARSAFDAVFGGGKSDAVQVDLQTHTKDASCSITFGKKKLEEDDTRQQYEEWVNCKPLSDATIEHEKVHQARCLQEYASDAPNAARVLVEPSISAESEVLAHQRHKELIEVAIRDIIEREGCGWLQTERQRADPRSVPSLKQMQEMNRRANNAARLLNTPSPSFKH